MKPQFPDEETESGEFKRQKDAFRERVSNDGSPGKQPLEWPGGRFHRRIATVGALRQRQLEGKQGMSAEFAGAERALMLVLAVAGIQGRLLCNMLDGMVAIEGGRQTKSGEIFNDLPDRIADALIFICAGYAARMRPFGVELGDMRRQRRADPAGAVEASSQR